MNLSTNHPGRPSAENSSRAEQLRRRRTEQSAQPAAKQSERVPSRDENETTARQARPVTVRNATFGTPVRRRVATTNPRRQYYVALNTPGAELRLPALPTLRPGPRLLSGLIAIICLIGIFSMLFSSLFIVGAPVVKGLERLTQADIEAALDIANMNAVEIDTGVLRAALLERFDILDSATVTVGLPNTLSVRVKERTPSFVWQMGDQTRWGDENGFLFAPAGESPQLLTITSPDAPPFQVTPEQLAAIQAAEANLETAMLEDEGVEAARAVLEKAKNPSGARQIDQHLLTAALKLTTLLPEGTNLTYTNMRGLGWQDAGGWDVYIGSDLSNFDHKYALYQSIIQQLNGQGITPAVISVEYLEAPYYQLER
jgi:hypothetical protein